MRDEAILPRTAPPRRKSRIFSLGSGPGIRGLGGHVARCDGGEPSGSDLDVCYCRGPGKERAGDQAVLATGDPSKLFMLAATDADVQALTQAIEKDGTPKTQELLGEFTISHRIYQLNAEGSPDSNRIRAELLKQQFLADYSALQQQAPEPRVLIKFGDFHMYRASTFCISGTWGTLSRN